MVLFGHRFIESESFFHIPDIGSIDNTPPNSTVYVEFSEKNLDIIKHAIGSQILTSIHVNSITELIYAAALGASYIVVNSELAKSAQSVANEYILDAKILVHIEDEAEIEELAILGVDGVIFANAILRVNT